MDCPRFCPVLRLRPVIYLTGITSAAVTSYFLFHRWLEQKRMATDAVCSAVLGESAVPSLSTDHSYEEMTSTQLMTGHLVLYKELCTSIQRTNQMYAHTFTQQVSFGEKQVEVTLQHKSVHNGLESEHWWVLTNECYHLFPEEFGLAPMYVGSAKVVAYFKRIGHYISVVNIVLKNEMSNTSVLPTQMLQTKLCTTTKGVTISEDGCFYFSESSDTNILETPLLIQPAARPAGPPPGFQ